MLSSPAADGDSVRILGVGSPAPVSSPRKLSVDSALDQQHGMLEHNLATTEMKPATEATTSAGLQTTAMPSKSPALSSESMPFSLESLSRPVRKKLESKEPLAGSDWSEVIQAVYEQQTTETFYPEKKNDEDGPEEV